MSDSKFTDLIEPWREPRKVKVDFWVNVYPNSRYGFSFSTKKEADQSTIGPRIACIHIEREITEGEGL